MTYWLVIIILTIVFIYNLFLTYLNDLSTKRPIPENVIDIYDDLTYQKWLLYHYEKNQLNKLSIIAKYILMLILIITNAFSLFCGLFPQTLVFQTLAVILLYTVSTTIFATVFQYIDTMKIEEKYGFNKTTKKTFFIDTLKSFLIEFIIMFGLIYLFGLLHQTMGNWFILIFSVIVIVFLLIIFAFNSFFIRIFNKIVPLEEGSLRTKLETLLTSNGYKVREIGVIDGSKRSTKANAFFTGIGKLKTIALYDTLIEKMTEDEIVAVFAHELAHGKHKDVLKGFLSSILTILIYITLGWLLVSNKGYYKPFGFNEINYGFAIVILIEVILDLFNPLIGLIENALSRKHEYEADRFASENGYGKNLISGLKKLCRMNFSNLNPHPFLVKITYSHPPISERLKAIEKNIKD